MAFVLEGQWRIAGDKHSAVTGTPPHHPSAPAGAAECQKRSDAPAGAFPFSAPSRDGVPGYSPQSRRDKAP